MTSSFANYDDEKPSVVYRPFTEADFDAVARLFQAQWCCGISEKAACLASQIDLCSYLEQANWSLIAEKPQAEGCAAELLGATLLGLKNKPCPEAADWAGRREALLAKAAEDPALLAEVKADNGVIAEETQVADEYVASGQLGSAAELKLLIVGPAAKGLGIGGRLFSAAREAAYEAAGGLFLITDDSCDVGFYDHKKLTRMVTRPAQVEFPGSPRDGERFNIYVYAEGDAQ